MYFYIYDSFLHSHRFQRVLNKIENRLHDLGINGRVGKLSMLKNLSEIVSKEYDGGIRNFIAVGNDQTLLDVINATAELDCSVGYIPIGADNYLAKEFGIPPEDLACDVLSARIVKPIDLGRINNYYFLQQVKIVTKDVTIKVKDGYSIKTLFPHSEVLIVNLGDKSVTAKGVSIDDGKLNIIIRKPEKGGNISKLFKKSAQAESFFTVDDIEIKTMDNIRALVDNYKTFKLPIHITACEKQSHMIVGRNRKRLL